MSLGTTQLGPLTVSRLIVGSNPFSGFSHQGVARDEEMLSFYTTAHIKDALRGAEALGLTTFIGRADHHIMRVLREYWDEGGTLQWLAQTCPELGAITRAVQNAITGKASACYIHGGSMDNAFIHQQFDEVHEAIAMIRDAGIPVGVAGHNPNVFRWAEEHLDVDFYMCSYYNPIPRHESAEHAHGTEELFRDEDRAAMTQVIPSLSKPVIHYKVLAAGRNTPADAFAFVARYLRPQDAVCIGIFTKDKPDMLAEDMRLLEEALAAQQAAR